MGTDIYTVIRSITEEQEKELDENEFLNLNGHIVDRKDIYCYGEFNVNNDEDLNYIKKFNIIDFDAPNLVHVGYNFEEGTVLIDGNIAKTYSCYNNLEWFKYNYLLIGKPNRIIIYKCKKHELC